MQKRLVAIGVLVLCLAGCHKTVHGNGSAAAIVGAWVVKIPNAPFPLHMFVFHSDGTVEQSNPDSGDPNASDSNLMGAWRTVGDHYQGNLVEISADRVTHKFASRGEISFDSRSLAMRSPVQRAPHSSTGAVAESGVLFAS